MVVFGGQNGTTLFGDVAVYDMVAQAWLNISTSGTAPSPRVYHSAVVGIFKK
jgi:hypothetical protein